MFLILYYSPVPILQRSTAQSLWDQNGSLWAGKGISYRIACFNHKAGTEASLKKTKSHPGLVTRSTAFEAKYFYARNTHSAGCFEAYLTHPTYLSKKNES